MTLEALADRAGCTKGYLSSIETGKRGRPPSEGLLARLEVALGLDDGVLVERGRWESTPAEVRGLVLGLEERVEDGARLAAMVVELARDGAGMSGEFVELAERMVGGEVRMRGGAVRRPVAVRVTGAEMEPAYVEGDVVLLWRMVSGLLMGVIVWCGCVRGGEWCFVGCTLRVGTFGCSR